MNIVQKHLGIKSRLDQVNTPRFEDSQIDNAINTVISYIVRLKVAGTVENGQRVSFQRIQVIRDELYTIIKEKSSTDGVSPITIDSNKNIQSLPADYRYMLGLYITVNNIASDWCSPITYNDLPILKKNPYQRPSQDFPYNFYYIEKSDGLECFYNKQANDTLNYAKILYLSEPVTVFLGNKYGPGTTTGSVIAYTDVTYNDITQKAGTAFTIGSAISHTEGKVVKDFVNSDLPNQLHEEIVKEAAIVLNKDIENFDKWKVMREDAIMGK
jgi:hypothetical protein